MISRPEVVSAIAALITETFPTDPFELGLAIRSAFPDATPVEVAQAGITADQLIQLDHEHANQIGGLALLQSQQKRGLA